MKYKVVFPFIPDMGSFSPMIANSSSMESVEENALWHLNKAREHDGLKPLTKLPFKTKIEPIY